MLQNLYLCIYATFPIILACPLDFVHKLIIVEHKKNLHIDFKDVHRFFVFKSVFGCKSSLCFVFRGWAHSNLNNIILEVTQPPPPPT